MCGKVNRDCRSDGGAVCSCDKHLSRFIEARLLLLLMEKESYGYDLMQRINGITFSDASLDPGAVYKTLRGMEKDRLISSEWDTRGSGAAKRIYLITSEGEERLFAWVISLRKRRDAIEKFIVDYEKMKGGE